MKLRHYSTISKTDSIVLLWYFGARQARGTAYGIMTLQHYSPKSVYCRGSSRVSSEFCICRPDDFACVAAWRSPSLLSSKIGASIYVRKTNLWAPLVFKTSLASCVPPGDIWVLPGFSKSLLTSGCLMVPPGCLLGVSWCPLGSSRCLPDGSRCIQVAGCLKDASWWLQMHPRQFADASTGLPDGFNMIFPSWVLLYDSFCMITNRRVLGKWILLDMAVG